MAIKVNAPLSTTMKSRRNPLILAAGITIILLIGIAVLSPHTSLQTTLQSARTMTPSGIGTAQCPFPIVYNKPPKTASSYITSVIMDWAEKTGRTSYKCSMTPLITAVLLADCLPQTPDPCSILNCHVFLTPSTRAFLQTRMPGYRVITSTRYPAHRIVSFYLQINGLTADNPEDIYKGLTKYLNAYNPWGLFNYHTGQKRTGDCPLNKQDMLDVFDIATDYDVVLDANLRNESNAILKHFGLFSLPDVADTKDREKERGAWRLQLPDDIKALVKSKTCVEVEMHKMFQLRMASLYELATGKPCLRHGSDTRETISSCIEDKERDLLGDNWLL